MADCDLSAGEKIQLTIDRIAYGGEGVGRHGGLVVFVPLAAPGDTVRVMITERRKRFARGRVEALISSSPVRRQPECRHFGDCGGCQLQHISYEAQLQAKAHFIRDALARIGRLDWSKPIEVRSAAEYGYRTRAQVTIQPSTGEPRGKLIPGVSERSTRDSRDISIGFNRLGSRSVCDVDVCPVLTPGLNDALATLRSSVRSEAPLNVETLDIAEGDDGAASDPEAPGLSGGSITRAAAGAVYRFGPASFFQANRFLIDDLVRSVVDNERGSLAVDLYAGVGLFTVQLAGRFHTVVGVESDEASARFARENLAANGAANAELHTARAEAWCRNQAARQSGEVDLLTLNPPRTGAAGVIDYIAKLRPRRITYVSCDPATLARDLRGLVESNFELVEVEAFDLFPQTYHVETVARLQLRAD